MTIFWKKFLIRITKSAIFTIPSPRKILNVSTKGSK